MLQPYAVLEVAQRDQDAAALVADDGSPCMYVYVCKYDTIERCCLFLKGRNSARRSQ